jgi:excisionase family DNA binding protein
MKIIKSTMGSVVLIDTDDLKKILKEILNESLNQKPLSENQTKNQVYLNRFEVAEMLKISLPTLNLWSKNGIIQSYRIGNRVLYKADEIDKSVQIVKNLKYKRG